MSPDAPAGSTGADEPADLVARTVLDVPGVHALHAGAAGEVATYLPGRRVVGVRPRDDGYDVHVVVGWGSSLADVGQRVRAAVQPLVTGPVDVTVEDVAPPGAVRTTPPPSAPPSAPPSHLGAPPS